MDDGVRELLDRLTDWARETEWVEWLEVGGSIGRGAADRWSDIDAGIGIRAVDRSTNRTVVERAEDARLQALDFAGAADSIIQPFGDARHVIVVYRDGRQLSLVVMDADKREGLAPQSIAAIDKAGRLETRRLPVERWNPSPETRRDWAFEAWIDVGDAARHAARGHFWRALRSLGEARELAMQLWAAERGLTYPQFGAVTVENAGESGPDGIGATHPSAPTGDELIRAATALAGVLRVVTSNDHVDGVATSITARLGEITTYD